MDDKIDPWVYIKETVKIVAKAIIIIAFIIGLTMIGLEAFDDECKHGIRGEEMVLDSRVEFWSRRE